MRNVILLAVLFITSNLFAQNSIANEYKFDVNKAEFVFEQEVIDYGTIEQYSNGYREFVFTNTGNQPLIITKVKSSCGCTVATKPQKPVLSNESANIGVKYDTKRLGNFSKIITITSNAKQGIKQVKIKGTIVKK